MKTNLRIVLIGEPLPGLLRYQQELENQRDAPLTVTLDDGFSYAHQQQLPDLLFINCGRDELFGLPLLRKVKRLYPKLPVILAIDMAQVKIGRHAVNRGALAYLIKDVRDRQQVEIILHLIGKMLGRGRRVPRLRPTGNRMTQALRSWRLFFQPA